MNRLHRPPLQWRIYLALAAVAAGAATYMLGRPLLATAAWPSHRVRRWMRG